MDENNNIEQLDIEKIAEDRRIDEQAKYTDPDSMGFVGEVEGVSEVSE